MIEIEIFIKKHLAYFDSSVHWNDLNQSIFQMHKPDLCKDISNYTNVQWTKWHWRKPKAGC